MSSFFQYKTNKVLSKKAVHYEGSDTLYTGYLLAYNQDVAVDMDGVAAVEGTQCNGKYLKVEKPATANLKFIAGVVDGSVNGLAGPRQIEIIELVEGQIVAVYTNANCVIGQTVLGIGDGSYLAQVANGDDDIMAFGVAMETVDRSETNGLVLVKVISTGSEDITTIKPKRNATTGDAYGLRIIGDDLLSGAGAAGPRSWVVGISADKTSGIIATADADDALLRISGSNYVPNEEIFNFRGINVCVKNRGDGVLGELDNIISVADNACEASELATMIALKLDNEHMAPDNPDEVGGLDIALCREGGAATVEYGLQIRTRGTINTEVNSAIRLTKDATDHGFTNLLNIETDAVNVAAAAGDVTWDTSDITIPIVFNGNTYLLYAQEVD